MEPTTRSTKHPSSAGRAGSSDPAATPRSDLHALSKAGRRYNNAIDKTLRPQRGRRLAVAVLAALAVGAAVFFLGGSLYRCTATVRLSGGPDPQQTEAFRRRLLDFAWGRVLREGEPVGWIRGVTAASSAPGLLSLTVITSNPRVGVEQASAIVRGFQAVTVERADTLRRTPDDVENALSDRLRALEARGTAALAEVQAAVAAIPATDPSIHRETLLAKWRVLRSDFAAVDGAIDATAAELARLRAEPSPTQGLISSDARRKALEGDAALRQDLEELSITLTEFKLHLLNVWQASSGPLAQLLLSVEDFLTLATTDATADKLSEAQEGDGSWAPAARDYRDVLTAFSQAWDRRFLALKQHRVDPMAGDVLDEFQRARRNLNGFLFQAGRRLTTLREAVQTTLSDPRNAARRHVFESNLVRRFQSLEAAHHRFEFSAGTIETPENFRLDIALKSGRGLRRRCGERIDGIDKALALQAARHAIRGREEAVSAAKDKLDADRITADATVDELLALQDELQLSSTTQEAFLRAILKAETATARLETTQDDQTETELAILERSRARRSAADALGLELVTPAANDGPVNVRDRLQPTCVGGGVAFVVVFLLQALLLPRRQS